ncbi:MAG: hypothetical protein ACFE8C_04200 [Promethearchaeota archaeon]
MNKGKKIPVIPNSIILSTLEEMNEFENFDQVKTTILPYAREDDFEKYIIKLLAVTKISNKNYSEIIFSIDPGTKYLGLVIFLDDYYLNSHTLYDIENLIKKIWLYVNALEEGIPNPLKVIFKFGRGIIPITLKLIEQIFKEFKEERLRVLLIDEAKTSKYKIRDKARSKIPKDEAAALFISLRDGLEITHENYRTLINQKRLNRLKSEKFDKARVEDNEEIDHKLIEIAENVLKGNLSLSKSMELIKTSKSNNLS